MALGKTNQRRNEMGWCNWDVGHKHRIECLKTLIGPNSVKFETFQNITDLSAFWDGARLSVKMAKLMSIDNWNAFFSNPKTIQSLKNDAFRIIRYWD